MDGIPIPGVSFTTYRRQPFSVGEVVVQGQIAITVVGEKGHIVIIIVFLLKHLIFSIIIREFGAFRILFGNAFTFCRHLI